MTNKIKYDLIKYLQTVLSVNLREDLFIEPERLEYGDISLPTFEFAKDLKKSPKEIAEQFAQIINHNSEQKNSSIIKKAESVNGYLNIFLSENFLNKTIIQNILKPKKIKQKKERIMLEYSQPNTHKEFHVGHLRNACLGQSLVNILRECGEYVISATYVNDFGSHVAKSIWAFKNKNISEKEIKEKGKILGELYAFATTEADKGEKIKSEILEIFKKLESGDKETIKTWKITRKWSLEEFKRIYRILDIEFDEIFYESDYFKEGKKLVSKLLEKNILKQSQGAIIADLEKYKLGVLVFITKEGTSLYSVKDIPLAIEKFKKFKISKSIYLVDVRQSLYFKQLFKVLDLLSVKGEKIHLDYEFVTLPEGAISSRTGNIVSFDNLYDEALNHSFAETKKRHEKWTQKQIMETAKAIAISAIKFSMLKSDLKKVIVFDLKKSLEFSGSTGPYVLYTKVRAGAILRKMPRVDLKKTDFGLLNTSEEKKLIKHLGDFEVAILESAKDFKPSILANYLLELANSFNTFYHKLSVLQEKDEQIKSARIVLVQAVEKGLEKGLSLLGIKTILQM